MKVYLEAFDHLTGTMELPDNWSLMKDLHLPFPRKFEDWTRSAYKPDGGWPTTEVSFKQAIFRFMGQYVYVQGENEGLPRYVLVDLL